MKWLTDNELLEELSKRFRENEKAIYALNVMTKKLENLNRKLQESEQLKSNFISNIKNEINNPLTSILCMSGELISGECTDLEKISSMGNMIHSEAFNLDFQLRNIFAAAEFEAGEAVPCTAKVNIDTLIRNTIESLRFKSDKKAIIINYVPAAGQENNTYFHTDPDKLRLVILNLISNAIEYSHEEGRVDVMAWEKESTLYITVKDYGEGIDTADRHRIFDRFKQLDTGATKSHVGHGLGLSIVKAAAELLDGLISVESERGKGCVFTVSISESAKEDSLDIISDNGNEFIFEKAEEF